MTEEAKSEKGARSELPNNIKPLAQGRISREFNHTVLVLEEETFSKGRSKFFYSPASFYFVSFLSFIYLLLSLSSIFFDGEHSMNNSINWTMMKTLFDYLKLILAIFFLLEVILRMLFLTSSPHLFSYWIILDLVVVILCVYVESRFLYLDVNSIADYDEYFIPFRLWYTFRTIRQIAKMRELKEDELYEKSYDKLNKVNKDRDYLKSENSYMKSDLDDMRELIRDMVTRKVDHDQKSLISSRSSWQSLVPMQFCFNQNPAPKRSSTVVSTSKKPKASFLERRTRRLSVDGLSSRGSVFEAHSTNKETFDSLTS